MNKGLLVCLYIMPLLVGSVIGFTFFQNKARAQGDGIIIEGADYNSTVITEYSADLMSIAENVTPRTVVEYGDSISNLGLYESADLNQVASTVTPRIIVEYADLISDYGLQHSENLTQIATTVVHRIIVEYADFTFSTKLGPKPMEDMTPPDIGIPIRTPPADTVMPYKNVTVSVNITDTESGVKDATLHYNLNNSATWNTAVMSYNSTSRLYYATILGQSEETYVKYKIVAYDNAGNMAVEDNAGQYYTYTVIPEFPSILILPLFMIATLLAVIVYRRKHSM